MSSHTTAHITSGFHSASTTNGLDHSSNTNGRTFLFSSESVGDGHPGTTVAFNKVSFSNSFKKEDRLFILRKYINTFLDKVCDAVSDSVLDAFLAKDPNSKIGCGIILV